MARSFDDLLASSDDAGLCVGACELIQSLQPGEPDLARLEEDARTVYLVQRVTQMVSTGGFRGLFDHEFHGDPHYVLCASAFERAGCLAALDAIRKTMALFPGSMPPKDHDVRVNRYSKKAGQEPTAMDLQFRKSRAEIEHRLADFIRSRAETLRWFIESASETSQKSGVSVSFSNEFDPLDPMSFLFSDTPTPKPKPSSGSHTAVKPRSGTHETQVKPRSGNHEAVSKPPEGFQPAELPRWARTALAARCGRLTFPLFSRHWSDAPSSRLNSILTVLDLAEYSSSEASELDGLKEAGLDAMRSAEAVLQAKPGLHGQIASHAAKAAAKAAEAATGSTESSIEAVREAWGLAREAARLDQDDEIPRTMNRDFENIRAAASRGKWNDQTHVPPEVWTMF